MFSDTQTELLKAKLSSGNVKRRQQSGRYFSYIEGWHAIAEANRIFGFGNWSRETVETKCVAEREREIGQSKAPGFAVTYIARVRVSVWTEGVSVVTREGTGSGHGIDRDLGQAHESAIKEAETDAMKRALMTFGNQFGLALYDKDQEGVETTTKFGMIEPTPPSPTNRTEAKTQDKAAENVEWARTFIENAYQKDSVSELREWERTCLTRLEILEKQQPATFDWIQTKLIARYEKLEKAAA